MKLSAEVTITFEFDYNGTNEDLVVQLVKKMREVADLKESDEEDVCTSCGKDFDNCNCAPWEGE